MKRQILYALIIIGVCLIALESIARVIETQISGSGKDMAGRRGWQTEFFGSLFDWHESDPDLLWRFKAGLDNPLIKTNSDHLLGPEISKTKDAHTYRLLLLGDSSPVGLGLTSRRQAFGEQVRYLLDKQIDASHRVELVNTAVSGYTSEQIVRLLQLRGEDYDPDLVILYCGNNDASISGAYPDKELLAGQKLQSLRGICSHLALYRLMRAALTGMKSSAVVEGELTVRVSPERFGRNLAEIAAYCRRLDCPLIILKPPTPYLWPAGLQFKPFVHLTGESGQLLLPSAMAEILGRDLAYCWDEKRFADLYGEGDVFTRQVYRAGFIDSLDPAEAVEHYQALIRDGRENLLNYNNLGVACWRLGDYDQAAKALGKAREKFSDQFGKVYNPAIKAALSPLYFNLGINQLAFETPGSIIWYDTLGTAFQYLDSALQADYFSLRIKRKYLETIDDLAGEPGVTILDLPQLFSRNGSERLFVDHCHPTFEGHRLIAGEIVRTVRENGWLKPH